MQTLEKVHTLMKTLDIFSVSLILIDNYDSWNQNQQNEQFMLCFQNVLFKRYVNHWQIFLIVKKNRIIINTIKTTHVLNFIQVFVCIYKTFEIRLTILLQKNYDIK